VDDGAARSLDLSITGVIRVQERRSGDCRLLYHVTPLPYSWCGPCKLVAPTLEALRKEFAISVAKVDTDKADELSARFDIHAIPTYILLKKSGGEIAAVQTVVSAHTTKLRRLFEEGQNIRSSKN
jgi:hypothetical protein